MMILHDTRGGAFIVDDEDAEAVGRYQWSFYERRDRDGHGYLYNTKAGVILHQFIMGRAPDGLHWDHINRNTRDNRRSNLRAVTPVDNIRNQRLHRNSTSGLRGVRWQAGKWCAHLKLARRQIHLGRYTTKEAAYAARLAGEVKYWGRVFSELEQSA